MAYIWRNNKVALHEKGKRGVNIEICYIESYHSEIDITLPRQESASFFFIKNCLFVDFMFG